MGKFAYQHFRKLFYSKLTKLSSSGVSNCDNTICCMQTKNLQVADWVFNYYIITFYWPVATFAAFD